MPERFLLPDHPFLPPEAVQEVALEEFQEIMLDSSKSMASGLAEMVPVGFCPWLPTLIVAESLSEPTLLLQVMLKVVVLNNDPVAKVPERFLLPDHPFAPPEAVQEVALVEVQLSVLAPP